jgi:hypothetical protein
VGLRLHAALSLQGADIDGQRLQGHVHRGKGAKDRSGPLPADTLALLRTSWTTHRQPTWLLPATGRQHPPSPPAASPRRRSSGQGAFRPAQQRACLTPTGVAIPTLRPASATPRLDAGVKPRLIQRYLGHTHRATTMVSLPLTHKGHEDAYERLSALMQGLLSCPPCVPSLPPLPRSTLRVIPTFPSHTARSSALSNTGKAAPTDTASRSAHTVGGNPASSMPVATATARSVSSRKPRNGSSTTWPRVCHGPQAAGRRSALHRDRSPRMHRGPAYLGPAAPVPSPPPLYRSWRWPRRGPRNVVTRQSALLWPGQSPLSHLPRSVQRQDAPRRPAGPQRPPGLDPPLERSQAGQAPWTLRLHLPGPLCLHSRHRQPPPRLAQ